MGRADGRQEGGSEEVVSSSPLSSSPLSTDVQATEALPLYGTTVYALGRDGVMTITETTSVTTVTTSTTTTTPAAATSAGARTTGASSATAMDTGVADAAAFGISSDAISSDASATEERRRAGAGVDYILEAGGAAGAGRAAQRKAGGLRGREGWSVTWALEFQWMHLAVLRRQAVAMSKMIAAGSSHSLVVLEEGVCSFGNGARCRLGHGSTRNELVPRPIDGFGSTMPVN